jgi:hypothetical protein
VAAGFAFETLLAWKMSSGSCIYSTELNDAIYALAGRYSARFIAGPGGDLSPFSRCGGRDMVQLHQGESAHAECIKGITRLCPLRHRVGRQDSSGLNAHTYQRVVLLGVYTETIAGVAMGLR